MPHYLATSLNVNMPRRTYLPANKDFYRGVLTDAEFNSILFWDALERNRFVKAIGKRGRPTAFSLRLRTLREIEVDPPTIPPPLAGQDVVPAAPEQDEDMYEDQELDFVEIEDDAPPPPPPLAAAAPPPTAGLAPIAQAARSVNTYVQQVGQAASTFMLSMSTATTDFVTRQAAEAAEAAAAAAGAPPTCSICLNPVREPYMGKCSHMYCRVCVQNPHMMSRHQIEEADGIEAITIKSCPMCRREQVNFYRVL